MIKLENLSKYYVGSNEVALGLRKINLEFELGELVAITGESGSGKSTLLNVLSGSDTYEEGEMYINGKPTSYYDETDWESYRRDNIGFIYQSYNLIDSYSVFENVNVALAIKGNIGDNTEKVYEYLEKVGIRHLADKKASQLSSGQKQRLAIARALAKETQIIVADEPTGNLDSENSAEVMAILNQLAVDKLVFVVTHNYDEIENYATRKIRMRDGEVEEDINLRPKKLSGRSIIPENKNLPEKGRELEKIKRKTAKKIVSYNRKNKPMTFAFLFGFMTVAAAAFYILLGSFFSNLDNTTSKTFSKTNFKNDDITRIIVKNPDDSEMTADDVEKISEVSKVENVDLYDSVSDMYYVYQEGVDYTFDYYYREDPYSEANHRTVKALVKNQFMKTVSCINDDDLSAGELASGLYDVVLYTDNEKMLGKTVTIFIGSEKVWGSDMAELTCTVTGILKEETEQIYFSEKLGKMLCSSPDKYVESVLENVEFGDSSLRDYSKDKSYDDVISVITMEEDEEPKLIMTDYGDDAELEEVYAEQATLSRLYTPIFIINENLTGNEVIISEEFVKRTCTMDSSGMVYPMSLRNIIKYSIVSSDYKSDYNTAVKTLETFLNSYHRGYTEEQVQARIEELSKKIDEAYALAYADNIMMVAQQDTTDSTQNVIEISPEMFELIAGDNFSTQVAVYIKDYAYADWVLEDIKEMGYVAASVYRVAAEEYDMELVNRKAVSMSISLGALFLVFFVGIFIIGMIMNLSGRDFKILRLLGLERSSVDRVNLYSILEYMILAVVVAMVLIGILYIIGVPYVVDIVKYYRIKHYLIYAVCLSAFTLLLNVRTKARMKKLKALR